MAELENREPAGHGPWSPLARRQYAAQREHLRYTVETNKATYLAACTLPVDTAIRYRRRTDVPRQSISQGD